MFYRLFYAFGSLRTCPMEQIEKGTSLFGWTAYRQRYMEPVTGAHEKILLYIRLAIHHSEQVPITTPLFGGKQSHVLHRQQRSKQRKHFKQTCLKAMPKSCCLVSCSNKSQNTDICFVRLPCPKKDPDREELYGSKLHKAICYPDRVFTAAPIVCRCVKQLTCATCPCKLSLSVGHKAKPILLPCI